MPIERCELCPRRCEAPRDEQTGGGYCGMPSLPRLARAALHYGEEPCISGSRGSGAIFFSGCTLNCVYCQNHTISHDGFGKTVSVQRLADIFRELEAQGAHNINLVSPTPFSDAIIEALRLYRPAVPIVYNCSGYERVETLRKLAGYVDIYLPDYKYASGRLAGQLSGAPDYPAIAQDAIMEMFRQTGNIRLDGDGMAVRGTMVRHLVLPGHINESIHALQRLEHFLPPNAWMSLLFQYTPVMPLPQQELNRPLTAREYDKVWDAFTALCFTEGYAQDRDSARTEYIPLFDLTGV